MRIKFHRGVRHKPKFGLNRNMLCHDAFPEKTSLAIHWDGRAGPAHSCNKVTHCTNRFWRIGAAVSPTSSHLLLTDFGDESSESLSGERERRWNNIIQKWYWNGAAAAPQLSSVSPSRDLTRLLCPRAPLLQPSPSSNLLTHIASGG